MSSILTHILKSGRRDTPQRDDFQAMSIDPKRLKELEDNYHYARSSSLSVVRSSIEARRITPELIEFYKKRGLELRAEYYRDMLWRAIWTLLTGSAGALRLAGHRFVTHRRKAIP